ncbi:MAG TPA: glycosyltransferase family 39 protein [Vicinamibacterales bacterium]|nr:glycosyltransferase family 39 protein [Vicinamibacterales bacterium]
MTRRFLWIAVLIALAHGGLFVVYQRGEWESATAWTDQQGYQRLGASLATTGRFTRYDIDDFVPEVIRTPGYPAFIAVIYLLFGVGNDMAVAIAQVVAYAGICALVFLIGRRAMSTRAGLIAALIAALYPPLPHFASLILTELWTTFVATLAMLWCLRACQRERLAEYAIAGVLLSAVTLVRPAFLLMPFFFAVVLPVFVRSQRTPAALGRWAALAIAAALTLTPWFTYNYVYLGQFTISPAGGLGRALWEGTWQGHWRGKLQAELIVLADTIKDRNLLNERVRAKGAEAGLPAEPMLEYVNEWRDIRYIWDTPTDPRERIRARVAADEEYYRHAMENMRHDPVGHLRRRLLTGTFVLWAAEVPIRYQDVNTVPTIAIRAIFLAQIVLMVLAAVGVIRLARHGRRLEAVLLTAPIVYVTAVHLPLLCEARQSLPVKPVVIVLAAIALQRWHGSSITSPQNAAS